MSEQPSKKPVAIITSRKYQNHQTGHHPESPARAVVLDQLADELCQEPTSHLFSKLEPVPARLEQVATVHHGAYLAALEALSKQGGGQLDLNTLVSPASYDTALLAAGGLLQGVDAVMKGEADKAFGLVRPPGHHAVPESGLGFCLLNNVAVATRHLLDFYGLERILIVDWDVHHGNGTQDIFYHDPRVLFFSTHEYPLYPGTGDWRETGQGQGAGYNINLPLPGGCGDKVLERAYDMILEPLVERYKPQFILVSAGYDAHWRDPLSHLNMSTEGYVRLTSRLIQMADTFCQGRLVLSLEGGYDLTALSEAVRATLLTLAGNGLALATQHDTLGRGPGGYSPEAGPLHQLWQRVRQIHRI